jgi:hypothetical protein
MTQNAGVQLACAKTHREVEIKRGYRGAIGQKTRIRAGVGECVGDMRSLDSTSSNLVRPRDFISFLRGPFHQMRGNELE